MKRETLFQQLQNYHEQDIYPFHMPGHKRSLPSPGNLYQLDITEIEGFDSLHHANGILKDISKRASALYQAEDTYLLVNGSTAGLLCAISACTRPGGKVLVARNCHRAVYHGLYLNDLQPVYLYPKELENWGILGGIAPEDVKAALKIHKDVQAVIITSPTYEGVVSPVEKIADCCHRYGVPLIVDEAHGAHFGLGKHMPESAVTLGADLVIQSLHKTMPALTQTALLHVNGNRIDRSRVRRFFSIYQTSSPSYVLMGSIEQCISLMETEGEPLFRAYEKRLADCKKRLSACKWIRLFAPDEKELREGACQDMDPGRFVFSIKAFLETASGGSGKVWLSGEEISGGWLMEQLRGRYHLELEMAGLDYVTAIVTVMDTEKGLERLCRAIEALDVKLGQYAEKERFKTAGPKAAVQPVPVQKCHIAEAMDGPFEVCPVSRSRGFASAEFVCPYPPGIPLLVPGELITDWHLQKLKEALRAGIAVEGPEDHTLKTIRVVQGSCAENTL